MEPGKTEKKYWGSLAEFESDPQFIENSHKEFLSSPLTEGEDSQPKDGFGRRDFMKLMAASTALASSACFQRPMHKILPYVNQPEEITFGVPNYYASTCVECSAGCGTLVKTREGRPIKLEGNPDHPMNKGALCARGQASILNLYDPDRIRKPLRNANRGSAASEGTSWQEIDKTIGERLKGLKTAGRVRVLSGTIHSPSSLKIIKEFLSGFKNGSHVVYDPLGASLVLEGQEASYGSRILPRYRFDKAEVIVSIDADFLGTWISPVEFTKQFAHGKKISKSKKRISKLITFESVMTLTGSNADQRIAIRPRDGARIALALAHELVLGMKVASFADQETLKKFPPEGVAHDVGFDAKVIKQVARELWTSRGKSIVVGGSPQSQSADAMSLQVAVNLLNSLLQNDGVTVDHDVSPSFQGQGSSRALIDLVQEMNAGHVDALFIYKANPVYDLPASMGFEGSLKKVGLVISFSDHPDETSQYADFICPDHHGLESWGDAQPQKNLFSLVQPTIRPVYDTRSFQDSLLAFNKAGDLKIGKLSTSSDWHEYIQTNWKETIYKEYGITAPFVTFWESTLRDGVFDGVAKKGGRSKTGSARKFNSASLKKYGPTEFRGGDFQLALYSQVAQFDGKNAGNPWLQELPDPITRLTWDNYASVSPQTAGKFGLKDGDLVKIKMAEEIIELPAHVQPGQHGQVIAVALGYGRTVAGQAEARIGKNMFKQAKSNDWIQYAGFPVSLTKTGAKYPLASLQEHHTMEGRPIIKEATWEEYEKNPYAGNDEKEELTSLWTTHEYPGYRWAMAIDMNSCTGCSACVVACQAENNVSVVGKDGVMRGRIMHWIRIDRYYTGTPDNPQVAHQPMLCQHCENAPCETVCPVVATVHDSEGLNQQIYNRCVGTRYCANNCPYKVRRFNWFEYNYGGQVRYPANLSQNPEVTVRSRGVMEKCSFCIQRITDSKNTAKDLGREVEDGEIKTACQQSCPADAIVFGNINDPESEVSRSAKDPRGYHVLADLNTRPSITYMTKIRNSEQI